MLGQSNSAGDHVKLSIEDFRKALDIIGLGTGQEAVIVAQFVVDLAATSRFRPDGIEPAKARQLLSLRIARHRVARQMLSVAVH